jgi:ABC-type nitrate/sulfonate/bicarbonate transport system ATPase subunit
MSEAIRVRGVDKAYALPGGGERLALRGIDLTVEHGAFVCLLGPSGCGKTTLLNVMSGLDRADRGEVSVHAPDSARRPILSHVFQESRLLPWLTVAENVHFVVDGARREARERAAFWLDRVGLAGRDTDYPRQLSIGQQQRVAVARALVVQPDILFMDEPFSALDELTATKMREELLTLWSDLHATVVFVTHNPLEATFLADRIVIMTPGPGRIVEEYAVSDLVPRPRDGDDPRLWEASRVAVRALRRGDDHAS